MAGLKNADHYSEGEQLSSSKVGLVKFLSLVIGGGALLLFIVLYFAVGGKAVSGTNYVDSEPVNVAVLHAEHLSGVDKSGDDTATVGHAMGYSWLFAVVFFLTLAVGGIFWTLLHNATNSGWGVVVRRLMENLAWVIPVVMILALPLVVPGKFRTALWEWIPMKAQVEHESQEHAEHDIEKYQAQLVADKETATSEFKSVQGEIEGAIAKATSDGRPGDVYQAEARLAKHQKKIDAILAKEVSVESLADKHFKHEQALLYTKTGFLNVPFWTIRFVFAAIGLCLIPFFMRRWSVTNDLDGDPKWFRRMRRAACGFLPLFAVAWTFLVFDWLMALDYTWFSTMWGVYLFAGAALNSMALLIILLTYLRKTGHLTSVVTMEHYHILGKLLLAFTIFWAYIAFSQYFLIWFANITEETKFYLERNTLYWNSYTIAFLVIGHFFIPFSVLLIQKFKKIPFILCGVAVWSLCMHLLDIYWIIMPERGISLSAGNAMSVNGMIWADILAFLAIGGLFVFVLLRNLGQHSLFPCRDPRLDESLNLVN